MKKNWKTLAAFVLAAVLIFVGICQKQPLDVLSKAIKICLECIGIG